MKPGPKANPYGATEDDYATTYQQEYVRCGKPTCRKCGPDGLGPGPYWYAYHYSPARGRRVKTYHGKERPAEAPSSADGISS